jgi:hypothetical protein
VQDTKLFETILGLRVPWHIARVELNTNEQRVDLWLDHDPVGSTCAPPRGPRVSDCACLIGAPAGRSVAGSS